MEFFHIFCSYVLAKGTKSIIVCAIQCCAFSNSAANAFKHNNEQSLGEIKKID